MPRQSKRKRKGTDGEEAPVAEAGEAIVASSDSKRLRDDGVGMLRHFTQSFSF